METNKTALLIMEDDDKLRAAYQNQLEASGFRVTALDDGSKLESCLQESSFSVILSDTDMCELDGHVAVDRALKRKLIAPEVMIVGMSELSRNQDYWRGIANFDCFYEKDTSQNIGEFVRRRYNAFLPKNAVIPHAKMPNLVISED